MDLKKEVVMTPIDQVKALLPTAADLRVTRKNRSARDSNEQRQTGKKPKGSKASRDQKQDRSEHIDKLI
jgi:hypothetical protein